MRERVVVYGPGGYDPQELNRNVVEEYEVEVPDPDPTPEERLDALVTRLETAASLADVRAAAANAKRDADTGSR